MFMAYKKRPDGAKDSPVPCATMADASDGKRFPMGAQSDERGAFIWTYCAAVYWHRAPTPADDARDLAALPAPSAPLPSALGAIAGKLARGAANV